jgi:hypothetical protein
MSGFLLSENCFFGISEFFVAAVVAAIVDEFFGSSKIVLRRFPWIRFPSEEEAGAVEVDVGQEKFHGAALGDFPGFVEVGLRARGVSEKPQPSASEEALGNVVHSAGAAEAGHGGF